MRNNSGEQRDTVIGSLQEKQRAKTQGSQMCVRTREEHVRMGTHINEASIQTDSFLCKLCPSANVGPLSFMHTPGLMQRRGSRPKRANRPDLELSPMWQGDVGKHKARRSGQGSARATVPTRGTRLCEQLVRTTPLTSSRQFASYHLF